MIDDEAVDGMLGYTAKDENSYRGRFEVLERAGVVVRPNQKAGTPLRITDAATFAELSFVFFVAWLHVSIWNRTKSKLRANWVTLPNNPRTILSLARSRFPYVIPGRTTDEFLDSDFYSCNVDATNAPESRDRQILCSVLNRVRLNLGNAGNSSDISRLPSSAHCCGSKKARFWEFLNVDLDRSGVTASSTVGGYAIPIGISAQLATQFATGLVSTSNELGMVFEETLLLYAQEAAGSAIGIPHFIFNQPTESHEIDFALYETAGHKQRTNWEKTIVDQSLCAFEVTCGHLPDVSTGMEEPTIDGARPRAQAYGGSDHPHKKLVNFLSLRSLKFANLRFHYLGILPLPDEGLSHATKRALRHTDGFSYWCLADEVADINTQVLNLEDKPLSVATLRDWHRRLVERVCQNARDFASLCAASQAPAAAASTSPPSTPAAASGSTRP